MKTLKQIISEKYNVDSLILKTQDSNPINVELEESILNIKSFSRIVEKVRNERGMLYFYHKTDGLMFSAAAVLADHKDSSEPNSFYVSDNVLEHIGLNALHGSMTLNINGIINSVQRETSIGNFMANLLLSEDVLQSGFDVIFNESTLTLQNECIELKKLARLVLSNEMHEFYEGYNMAEMPIKTLFFNESILENAMPIPY